MLQINQNSSDQNGFTFQFCNAVIMGTLLTSVVYSVQVLPALCLVMCVKCEWVYVGFRFISIAPKFYFPCNKTWLADVKLKYKNCIKVVYFMSHFPNVMMFKYSIFK